MRPRFSWRAPPGRGAGRRAPGVWQRRSCMVDYPQMSTRVEQQVEYWREGSFEALRTVPTLEREGFYAEALFWTHLAVEKALKAHVTKVTGQVPPLTHNLARLAELAGIGLTTAQLELCDELNTWQGIARYGVARQRAITSDKAIAALAAARGLREWLIQTL